MAFSRATARPLRPPLWRRSDDSGAVQEEGQDPGFQLKGNGVPVEDKAEVRVLRKVPEVVLLPGPEAAGAPGQELHEGAGEDRRVQAFKGVLAVGGTAVYGIGEQRRDGPGGQNGVRMPPQELREQGPSRLPGEVRSLQEIHRLRPQTAAAASAASRKPPPHA